MKPPTVWLLLTAVAGFALAAVWFAQLHLIGRGENSLLRQQLALADATLQSARNQLEAERLLAKRQLKDAARTIASPEHQTLEPGDLARLRVVTLAAISGPAPQALAVAVWEPEARTGLLSADKLPAAAADQDYQLWIIDPRLPTPVAGGILDVDPQTGSARCRFSVAHPVGSAARFAVSLERKGGAPKAEGPMVLISQ